MAKNKLDKTTLKREDINKTQSITPTTQSVASFALQDDVDTIVLGDGEQKKDKENTKNAKLKKPKKVYQKSTFKHKMKVIGCLAALGVFTGSGLGVWYFNTALKSNVDYT